VLLDLVPSRQQFELEICGRSTCKIAVMADWQSCGLSSKLNNHRSMHTCLFARTASVCGAWTCMPVACAVRCASCTRVAAAHATTWRARALGIRARAGVRRGGCHGQGRARVRRRGDLRHERNGASPFCRARWSAPPAASVRRGLRRTSGVCRVTEAPFSWPMARSRSAGAARSHARGRCARPGARAVTQTRTWSTGVRRWHRHWGTARLNRNVRS
jgi:hypothetical protein